MKVLRAFRHRLDYCLKYKFTYGRSPYHGAGVTKRRKRGILENKNFQVISTKEVKNIEKERRDQEIKRETKKNEINVRLI